jgi:hypothetical protein
VTNQAMTIPSYILNRAGSGALAKAAAAGLRSAQPPYVSIKGNRFTFVDSAGNQRPWDRLSLNVVLVDVNPHISKTYYDVSYDPQADTFNAPACWSDNGVGPSAQAEKPQSSSCAACPHNAWGSKVNPQTNNKTKACGDSKKLAVLVPEMENGVFLLRVPAASLKPLQKYAVSISGMNMGPRHAELDDVVTEISFEPDAVGVLQFKVVAWAPENVLALLPSVTGEGKTDGLVGKLDQPRQAALPAPLPAAPPAQVALLTMPPQYVPAPPTVGAQPAQPVFQTSAQPQAPMPGFPQAEPAALKGRGRPKKDASPAPAPSHQPFAFAQPQAAQSVPVQQAPAQPTQSFGMVQNAPVAGDDMAAQVKAAMGI